MNALPSGDIQGPKIVYAKDGAMVTVPYKGHRIDVRFSFKEGTSKETIDRQIQNMLPKMQKIAETAKVGEKKGAKKIEVDQKTMRVDGKETTNLSKGVQIVEDINAVAQVTLQFRKSKTIELTKKVTEAFKEGGAHHTRARLVGEIQISDEKIKELLVHQNPDTETLEQVADIVANVGRPKLNDPSEVGKALGFNKSETKNLRRLFKQYETGQIEFADIQKYIRSRLKEGTQLGASANVMGNFVSFLARQSGLEKKQQVLEEISEHFKWEAKVLSPIRTVLGICLRVGLPEKIVRILADFMASSIIDRVEEFKERDVGVMFTTGFMGHCVAFEIKKTADEYQIYIADTGTNCRLSHGKECLPITLCTIPATPQGLEDLKELLIKTSLASAESLDNANEAQKSQAVLDFNKTLKQHATIVEDLGILPRPIQTIGNCAFRSPEELILHRLGDDTQAASRFQTYFQALGREIIRQESESPLLRELANDTSSLLPRVNERKPTYFTLTVTNAEGKVVRKVHFSKPPNEQNNTWINLNDVRLTAAIRAAERGEEPQSIPDDRQGLKYSISFATSTSRL